MAYTDNFNDTDHTELSSHSSNWVDAGDANNMECYQNYLQNTVASNFHAYYYNQTFASAHYAKLKLISGRFIGPGVRMATGQNYYYCFMTADSSPSDKVYNGQVVSGSGLDWDSGIAAATAVNDVGELSIDPDTTTTVYFKVNDSTIQTYTGKDALSGGRAGVTGYQTNSAKGDDWEGGDIASSGLSITISDAAPYQYTGVKIE